MAIVKTTRLEMTLMEEGQRQKEIRFNEAINLIDGAMYNDLGEYTIALLPPAADNPNAWAMVTDGASGRTPVRSDGTNWKTLSDGTNTIREGATIA